MRLVIHLPEEQNVYFKEYNEELTIMQQETRNTMLTALFKLNNPNEQSYDEHAKNYLYSDVPYHYKWISDQTKWIKKQRNNNKILTRIYSVSPSEIEKYHLRLFLLHVKGPKSFKDLKIIGSVNCNTFREAAKLRGLLANYLEWEICLNDAVTFQIPKQLHSFVYFAYHQTHCYFGTNIKNI